MEIILLVIGVFFLALAVLGNARPTRPEIVYIYAPPEAETGRGGGCGGLLALVFVVIAASWLFSS